MSAVQGADREEQWLQSHDLPELWPRLVLDAEGTMVVESHITYNQEVKEGDEVDVNLLYFDHDKKRLQYKLEMIHKEKKFLASTIEILSLYVDLDQRKVSEFESEKIIIMKEFINSNSQKFKKDNLIFSNKLKK